jgi:DNA end-binding protein Ku
MSRPDKKRSRPFLAGNEMCAALSGHMKTRPPPCIRSRFRRSLTVLIIGCMCLILGWTKKERLCSLRPRDGSLMLETLFYADEVKPPETETPELKVSEAEMKVAYALIDLLHEPFDPTKYRDEYRDALKDIIEAKLDGQEYVAPAEPAAAAPAVDLMAALKASVEAAKKRKAGGEAEAAPAAPPETEKPSRSRAKKTPAGVS